MDEKKLAYGARQFGTPSYIFDTDLLEKHVQRTRELLGKICFAVKANPFLAGAMGKLADRLEICSYGEFRICRAYGTAPEKMFISGVLKKREELLRILEYCGGRSLYSVESEQQFSCLAQWAREKKETIPLCLRLSSGDQFGMDWKTLLRTVEAARALPYVEISGLHYFSGTRKRSADRIREELEMLDGCCLELEEKYGRPVRLLEYGPGFRTAVFEGQEDTLYRDMKAASEAAGKMRWQGQVVFEMGRALASCCGYYLTGIWDTKETDGQRFCITDGGLHQLHYDGQMMGMYHPRFRLLPERDGGEEWMVCGALCTSGDVLMRSAPLGRARVGDVLVFEEAGAYCATEGMALFLSRELPAVLLYGREKGWKLARPATETGRWNMDKEAGYGTFDGDLEGN